MTISAVVSNEGMIGKLALAKEAYSKEEAREKLEIELSKLKIDKVSDEKYNENEYITDYLTQNGLEVNGNMVKVYGYYFKIDRTVPKIVSEYGKESMLVNIALNESIFGEIAMVDESKFETLTINGQTYTLDVIVVNNSLKLDGTGTINGATLSENVYEFGNENDCGSADSNDDGTSEYATNMVVLKVDGDLEISNGITLTTCKNSEGYGGPKGFLIFCTGKITNNGTVSMTGRGANAEGQNVYMWKNEDGSYETVPAEGASGADWSYSNNVGWVAGNAGSSGEDRRTGGGGSGACYNTGWYSAHSRPGGAGTSYSGGSGSGGANTSYGWANGKTASSSWENGDRVSGAGSDVGGEGGFGNGAEDGVGNPGVVNGTGGLLIMFSKSLENNGTIDSNGLGASTGGSSGGGSINIFYTEEISNTGTIAASGGVTSYLGGRGGDRKCYYWKYCNWKFC